MNKIKLVMLRGLPGSGKSFWALEQIKKSNGKTKRVNKDDLRTMIDAGHWSRGNEKEILHARNALVNMWIKNGFDVIVDDTGFGDSHESVLREIADSNNADFEVKFFDTPFLECIERDAKRGEKSVGAKIIQRMYDQYLKPELLVKNKSLTNIFIFDIDGTLAIAKDRSHYDFTRVAQDLPNKDVVCIFQKLYQTGEQMFIVSGREDSCRKETEKWLKENNICYSALFMRKKGDNRKDSIVKREIYEEYFKDKFNILGVFEDRKQVKRVWNEIGVFVFDVNQFDIDY